MKKITPYLLPAALAVLTLIAATEPARALPATSLDDGLERISLSHVSRESSSSTTNRIGVRTPARKPLDRGGKPVAPNTKPSPKNVVDTPAPIPGLLVVAAVALAGRKLRQRSKGE